MDYVRQLAYKQAKAVEVLKPFGHVQPIEGAPKPWEYRCKTHVVFGNRGGEVITGYYRPFSHALVPVDRCRLEHPAASELIRALRETASALRIRPFDDEKMTGFLRHAVIRTAHQSGQMMLTLVTASGPFPRQEEFLGGLKERFPSLVTVARNINDKRTSRVLGPRTEILAGDGFLEEELSGRRFRLSPDSFFQVDPPVAERLYRDAAEGLALTGKETLLDAYCGTGTAGILAAEKAGRLIGVELNKAAVRNARENAALNGLARAEFFAADAGAFMTELKQKGERIDAVITDPPRSGCSPAFLRQLADLAPRRIAYISCEPKTLARDLAFLTGAGFRVVRMKPFDMFPQSAGIETAVILSAR